MKKLFALALLFGSFPLFAAVSGGLAPAEFREYMSIGVEKISVENTSGKITISPMVIDKIEIRATKKKWSDNCSYRARKPEFSEVTITVQRAVGEDCEVDFDIKVPPQVNLSIWSGSGAVNIRGVEGNLMFNVGSGSMNAEGKFKKIEGKSGSGSIDISGLTAGGNISVGSGPVNLRFLDSPTGIMDVRTGSGDANISFPKATKLKSALTTGSGSVASEIGNTDSSDFGLNVTTGSGDLKVKAY